MSEPADDSELRRHVERFATEVGDLVAGVVPDECPPFDVVVVPGAPTHVLVRQQPEEGVALSVGGEVLLLLQASYRCTWDTVGAYLAVRASSFVVRARAAQEPLFRYDYVADADDNVPVAHLNVHGHRDELVFAMMSAGRRLRGRSRAASVARGQVPRLSTFHFPVGGHRFRPSLEDVLEIVVREFGVDAREGWRDTLRAGRARWREKQLRAAVRDDPATATAALAALGYGITPPGRAAPGRRDERVLAL